MRRGLVIAALIGSAFGGTTSARASTSVGCIVTARSGGSGSCTVTWEQRGGVSAQGRAHLQVHELVGIGGSADLVWIDAAGGEAYTAHCESGVWLPDRNPNICFGSSNFIVAPGVQTLTITSRGIVCSNPSCRIHGELQFTQ